MGKFNRSLTRLATASVLLGTLTVSSSAASPEESTDDSLFPRLNKNLETSHFTWGVDVGSSIDLGGNDMSTFDAEAIFGYKNSFWQTLGVGAGVRKAFDNEYTFIPVFANIRTSFRKQPSLFFFDGRVGYSFNTLGNSGSQGGVIFSVGCGINLSVSKSMRSHIILSYSYYGLKKAEDNSVPYEGENINYAMLRIGINF